MELQIIERVEAGVGWGLDPVLAARELGYQRRFEDPDRVTSYDLLRSLLADRWLVITVHGGPWVVWLSHLQPSPASPHGPLLVPAYAGEDLSQRGMPHHCLVLVAAEAGDFLALDPYHQGEAQPFRIAAAALASALWTGEVLVPPPPVSR